MVSRVVPLTLRLREGTHYFQRRGTNLLRGQGNNAPVWFAECNHTSQSARNQLIKLVPYVPVRQVCQIGG